MRKPIVILALAMSCCTAPALADEALATAKGCLACHQVAVKVVGPAFQEVAARYKGNTDAATLAGKIKAGGVGVWGPIPMPPQVALSDEDATKLAQWILSQ